MKFKIDINKNSWNDSYKYLYIFPTLSFGIDKQMEDYFYTSENKKVGGIINYTLYLSWLIWDIYFDLEVINKKLKI